MLLKDKCDKCNKRDDDTLVRCVNCVNRPSFLCEQHALCCIDCGDPGPYCPKCIKCEKCGEDYPGRDVCITCRKQFDRKNIARCGECLNFFMCQTCLVKCECGFDEVHYLCKGNDLHMCHVPKCRKPTCMNGAFPRLEDPLGLVSNQSKRVCFEHRGIVLKNAMAICDTFSK